MPDEDEFATVSTQSSTDDPAEAAKDIFDDPEAIKMMPSLADTVALHETMGSIDVRKPSKHEFFRIHPDPRYRGAYCIIKPHDDSQPYLVVSKLQASVIENITSVIIYLCVNHRGTPFLWPVTIAPPNTTKQPWLTSTLKAVEHGLRGWTKMKWLKDKRAYNLLSPVSNLSDPIWPKQSFIELLRLGFNERVIDSLDHFILRDDRGDES
jgi:hypothetical protein